VVYSENLDLRLCDELFIFQISIPMSVEFEELAKLRDNPSDEQASKYLYIYCYALVYYPKLLILWCIDSLLSSDSVNSNHC
jgi:hypothetical protein